MKKRRDDGGELERKVGRKEGCGGGDRSVGSRVRVWRGD